MEEGGLVLLLLLLSLMSLVVLLALQRGCLEMLLLMVRALGLLLGLVGW